ncbi:MAG TPA: cobalamin-binding protein [Pyrinomonadaceae bacterium]|nr:cobalamin-binding protein [Pyrinomonadaceae bacterium]
MKLKFGIIVLCLFLVGCSNSKPTISPLTVTPEKRAFTDDLGRTVSVPTEIKRIVSLAPSATEMVYAVGAGDRLVGVTTFCNYPEQALEVAKVGDTMTPNMETIVALKPDVVLVSTASQIENFTKTLEQNGIAVYVMNPTHTADVLKSIKSIGDILGTVASANRVADELERRQAAIRSALGGMPESGPMQFDDGRIRLFVQISREPLFTIGKGSFLSQVVAAAGGISVTADVPTAYPKISKETALSLRPNAIILSDSEDNREPNEVFANSPAVKNGRVLRVNADILSRPGPRLIDAMEQIARFLHPDKFR